jgi:hypothetical protein
MSRIFSLLIFLGLLGTSCHIQHQSIALTQHDEEIFGQFRHTTKKVVKMKKAYPNQYYSLPKNNSGNYRVTVVGLEDKSYDFIFLKEKLARAWVQVKTGENNEWKSGKYYFASDELVYKEEEQEQLLSLEEIKKVAADYLQKAKAL